jgi:hypothetical protein
MSRFVCADKDRSDMQGIHHLLDRRQGNVGRIQVREDEQVGFALEVAVG